MYHHKRCQSYRLNDPSIATQRKMSLQELVVENRRLVEEDEEKEVEILLEDVEVSLQDYQCYIVWERIQEGGNL